ncbi:nitrite reductase [Actinocorallia sp. B10E7]|uniref:nitrite reductase n=1 Tax=Actinocorallia sp. B10E7 TaxID=3153558 RepID=UPI00325E1ADD
MAPVTRDRADRCPGVLRPWIADDGALIRLRLVGGELDADALRRLAAIAETFGDGNLHLTSRANLQIRGIAHAGDRLSPDLVDAVRATGLLPSPAHDRVRNILVSPLTGLASGRANLRPVAAELDRLLCADPGLAALPGKFLFCLDDGRGDVSAGRLDLGLFALDASRARLRIGTAHQGPVVPLSEAPEALLAFARKFLRARGTGDSAAWHVDELPRTGRELLDAPPPEQRCPDPVATVPPFGGIEQDDGRQAGHFAVPDGLLPAREAVRLASLGSRAIVTPWHSIIIPDMSASELF